MATLVDIEGKKYWEFTCAQCGKFNSHKKISGGKPPIYCNQHCYLNSPRFIIAHARAIRVYQLWLSGDYTLQAIGDELGGVSRERALQLVNRGRELTNEPTDE